MYKLIYNVIVLKLRHRQRVHVHCRIQFVLFYTCVYFASQSYPFGDFKEWFQEKAVDRGWTFTFAFHRSRVCATAERRLPRPHFEVSPQSRQCLHSSGTLLPPAHCLLNTHIPITLLKCWLNLKILILTTLLLLLAQIIHFKSKLKQLETEHK